MTILNSVMQIGPMGNNVVFLTDEASGETVVIDPSFEADEVLNAARKRGWHISQIWLTHGHYDHIWSTAAVSRALTPAPLLGMSQECYDWTAAQDTKVKFGENLEPLPPLTLPIKHGDWLSIRSGSGAKDVQARDVSGHNPGSILFYLPANGIAITGDAIFKESIGRTDLPGSDHVLLMKNLREQVLTLPDETVLIPGHGEATTVAHERRHNPFLA